MRKTKWQEIQEIRDYDFSDAIDELTAADVLDDREVFEELWKQAVRTWPGAEEFDEHGMEELETFLWVYNRFTREDLPESAREEINRIAGEAHSRLEELEAEWAEAVIEEEENRQWLERDKRNFERRV